jgi:septal ring factor EnvC (AmiA/AmiB activator)
MNSEEAKETLETIGRLIEEIKKDLKKAEEKERQKEKLKEYLRLLKRDRVDYII